VTLRALSGSPLEDEKVRAIVVSTAWAIGERTGIEVLEVRPHRDRIEVDLGCSRIASIGFAAELRRLTERWFTRRFPDAGHLWGPGPEPPRADESQSPGWRSQHEDDDDWWRGGESDLGQPG
jgi:hypothetical protein